MPRAIRCLTCVVLCVGLSAVAGCALTAPVSSRGLPPPSREVVANGVRLIVQEHPTSDIVALQLWVGVGGRDETPEERGFSHFTEHMLLAWYAAFFEAAGGGHDYPERYVRVVEAVSALDVQRVAGAYLAAPTIVSLGPSPQ